MPNNEYNFAEILDKCNKTYKRDFVLDPNIIAATISYLPEKTYYEVLFIDKANDAGERGDNETGRIRRSLDDFIGRYVYPGYIALLDYIIACIRDEEMKDLKIKILPSDQIRYAYLENNYHSGVGTLGKSCMRFKKMQKALNFYIKNNVKIVTVADGKNKIYARALLWDNVKSIERKRPFVYLDRVFTNSERFVSLFSDLAKENGWKSYRVDSAKRGKYYIDNLDITNMCHFPYTDTFRYLFYKDGLIAACHPSTALSKLLKHPDSCLHLTTAGDGGYQPTFDPNRVEEVFTRNFISKKDAVFIKKYNGYVLRENIADIDGVYYSVHDVLVVHLTLDGYALKVNVVPEAITNNDIDKTKAVYSKEYDGFIHSSNVAYIRTDEKYHKQDNDIICFDDRWYHISECFINYDKKEINRELAKPILTPRGNKLFVKPSRFSDRNPPGNYIGQFISLWHINRKNGPIITRIENGIIPKKYAIIAYDLAYSFVLDKILFQERYVTEEGEFIKLTTGEFVIDSPSNREYLKKFNNKWYIRREFKLPDKNQLMLF